MRDLRSTLERGESADLTTPLHRRQRQASLARSFDLADRRVDLELAWFVGIDWGSQKHQACVLDVGGKVVGEREFEHGGAGLTQMADWLLAFATSDAAEVGVAVETPRGPVVESLMERGFAVHSINPKQLDRFRDRISPAGAKDDRRDARVRCVHAPAPQVSGAPPCGRKSRRQSPSVRWKISSKAPFNETVERYHSPIRGQRPCCHCSVVVYRPRNRTAPSARFPPRPEPLDPSTRGARRTCLRSCP